MIRLFVEIAMVLFGLFAAPALAGTPDDDDTEDREQETLPLQSAMPQFSAPTLGGESFELRALVGRPALVNLWASWCKPCKAEIPVLNALHRRHAVDGLQVVGVSIDLDLATTEQTVEALGVEYKVLHDAQGVSARPFRVQNVPATFLFDRQGRLVWRSTQALSADDPAFAAALARALKKP
ncbi:MAG: TlpA family protein disulfide reductase [Myxococcales bacterium]|nr:TlpA family protein disulfide reductase [Myxococcales bacterium]